MPLGAPALLALALGLGLWLGALAGDPGRGCGPCPLPCFCGPAPDAACRVNCSGRWLQTLGPSLRIPADATALDLSHNLLQTLDIGLLVNLSALVELDLSNNRISTLEEGVFANLFNLSEINLSGNPFECNCGLAWLPRWAKEHQVHVVQSEATTCRGPIPLAGQPLLSIPLLDNACGEEYVACLPDNSSGAVAAVPFYFAHEGPLETEACSAFCFSAGEGLAALSEQNQCLCGAGQASNSSAACSSWCSSISLSLNSACGGPTLLQHTFPASPGATLVGPHGPLASGQPADFHITSSLPISSTRWNFGDGSPEVDMASPAATHFYVLPGSYHMTVVLALGAGSALLETEVQVEATPTVLELVCPSFVHSNESLELGIRHRGGSALEVTYSILALDKEPAQVVHPLCPLDTEIFPGNGHCYRLVAEKAPWLQAQEQCRTWAGAALAMVDSPAIQHFLVSKVTRSLDVWIGFSSVEGTEGLDPRGEAFSLESCQNWLPGEPHPATAEHCVRLGPAGQCNTDLCSAPHSYVCELRPGGPVWDTENFVMGMSGGGLSGPLHPLAQQETVQGPLRPVEVMVFPGLSPSREAFLTAAEFSTQKLEEPAQMRLQVYRPSGGAAVPEGSSEPDNRTEPAPKCVPEELWCPGANVCIPFDASCNSHVCINGSVSRLGLSRASYTLWKEFFFSVPAGPPTQYLVTLHSQDVPMLPGDLIGLQHDAGPGTLLQCPLASSCPGQALYLSTNASDWMTNLPVHLEEAWAGPVCSLQLLLVTERLTPLLGLGPNPGLQHPGHYEVRATVGNSVSRQNLSCSFSVVSPIAGLRVIHPIPLDGHIYVPTNGSVLVLQVDSGANATATAQWFGGNISAPFEDACPPEVDFLKQDCTEEANGTLFSVLMLPRLKEGDHTVEIVAQNGASQANLSLRVTAEEPICGLRAVPSPEARVLQGILVRYSPMVEAGSDVAFRWTIDDKQSLTFHNTVFNVIYQSAAIFKLSLTASNHVSNITVNYNVTVERMNKMHGLWVSAVPTVLPPNATLALTGGVLVDSAVEVAFLWNFGDGEQVLRQFKPPYDESFQVPDPTVAQVLVEHNTTHIYTTPGEYNLTVLVSNTYENLTQQVTVSVRTVLPNVAIGMSSNVLVAGQPITFSPYPLPSTDGVLYTWDFGDGSPVLIQSQPVLNHTYSMTGAYRITLEVNNTVSSVTAHADIRVFQELHGLTVYLSPSVEQGAPMVVSASVESGDNITWTFDMGDGTVFTGPEATVQHVYLRAQNFTVTVEAANPAGHLSQSLHVQVFVLEVLHIEPSTCIPTQPSAQLMAHVTGDPVHYLFDWTFGDGSSNVTVHGHPSVTHNFTRSGIFPLALVLSSHVNKAHYFTSICVEPEIRNITLQPERQFVKLGDEARLVAYSWPPFPYRYTWDFGTEDTTHTQTGGSEVKFIYREPGSYLVIVTVSNNISSTNDSAFVEVQEPVLVTGIRINGSHVLELQQPYLLSAMGSGSPATYLWELGDGSQSEGPEVTHIYSSTGDFTVRVSGWNEVSRSEAQLNITVKQRVRGLTINASRTVVPLNGSVSFSTLLEVGSDVHYSWVLCDRCTPIPGGPTISYTFRSVGTFNIIVTAENEVGSAQDSIFIYVLQFIEGLQVAGGDNGCCFPTNYTLQLQAAVRDGTNISYSWTAQQEGSLITLFGSGKCFSLTSLKASTYYVHLRATNMLGSAAANRTIDFVEPVESLILSASPNPAAVNMSLTLCAELAGGSGVVYTWYLEEGLSWKTSMPSTTHTFAAPGLHLVRVTAENQLGSVNATVEVAIQVPVGGLSIRTSEPDSIFVAAGSTLPFWGQLAEGTNVTWCWTLPGGSKDSQYIAVRFSTAGSFSLQLNASNAVSWVSAMYNLTVEEPIVNLMLWASSKVVAPGQPVHFEILLAAGSALTFRLQVGGSVPEVLPSPHFSHSFFRVGDHLVNVQAENHVSHAQAQVRILVLEAVVGLQVPNCCEPGMATGTEKNFTARVQRGSRVAYAWYFSLQKVQGDSLVILSGRDVTYTPVAAGLLEIHVRAFNELGGVNLTLMVEVQDIIQYVTLQSGRCFTNRSARFEAATSPSPRRVTYHWDFGDGTPVQKTEEFWADHYYLRPGDYHVEVNATNLVSFFVAQATVTVQVLACREPEVEVALPLQVLMRRSQRNYLEAHVDLRNCVSYQTEYRWEIYRTASCQRPGRMAQMVLPGVDVSRPQLVVPRLALPVGHYCFVFVVSFGDTPLARSIQANVTVAAERLVPIIEGGSYRVWSDTQDLVLDGSKSYDPNLEDGDQTPLNFHWACVASTQSETGGCVLNFGPRGSSVVTIPLERLEAGVEYTFNLIVWKAGRKEEATNQTVLIRSGRVPIVSLECVSCKAQAVYEVSRSSYVYLEGHCHNCSRGYKQGCWAARTFSNKTLVLNETTTSTGSTGMNLVVRPGALRDGEGYIFTLTVLGHSGEEEGCASIRLSPNRPPLGGSCRLFPLDSVRGLTTKVHFECTGWRDAEDGGAPLVYALLLKRCRQSYCENFCIYKGSLSTYGAVLPPGFQPLFVVSLAVVVQDQLGAAVVALNRSLTIVLPEPSGNPADLVPWLHSLTASVLPGLLKQADPQHVIEYSLALITVLNEYEQAPDVSEPNVEQQLRAQMRKNITETLISLRVNTVDDIQQITAALAQCMVSSRELMCRSCLKKMLQKLEGMMRILQAETTEGTLTPTTIADSILNITGDLIHLASLDMQGPQPLELGVEPPSLMVASKAYNLSSALMRILMRSRVLNEEPLTLAGEEIVALGKRSDPLSLLCYGKALGPSCHFSIPEAFSGALSNLSDVVQLIFLVDSNPFPFGYISNYTVSTKVASMAFQTQTGTQIPIEQLAAERAITVKVPNNSDQAAQSSHNPVGSTIVQPQTSVSAVVTADNSNPQAGLHLRITYTVLNERYLSAEPEPYLAVYLHSVSQPNEYNCSASRRISLEVLEGADHRLYTFFIAPGTGTLDRSYYLNLTSHFHWSALEVSVGLYTSLCQYFSEEMMMWRTEGIVPLEETSPSQAVCLTRHLTAFGASLFVPPSHVQFIFPEPSASINYIVLLTCVICLVTYVVMAMILRKLDQLDVSRVRVIPFCGKGGRFKYEILVKTGWSRGSGTTAHVGIMLYGEDNRSGHRHLDGDRAFHRNSLDIFQIATPHSLGSVWKIRVWHDNKGLSPAWFLQHIIVRDLQSARSTFFLVNDWLSVETEANGGLVEKEVLAANEAALWQFQRLLVAELQRGFFDKHIWLSIWDRPPRSRFTRVQRVTCCVLLLCLFLAANAVWYGVVRDTTYSMGPVSSLISPGVDTVAIGLVSSVVVYPVYLAVLFLFRMSRSKVSGDQNPTPTGQQALDVDSYLDPSVLDSSLLTLSGLTEAFAGQVKNDLFLEDAKSLVCWPSSEGTLSWPDLLSDPSVVSSTLQRLTQGRPGCMLGSEEDGASLVSPSLPAKYLSASDEDLIHQVLADGANNLVPTQDTLLETDLLTSLSSVPGEKTETLILQTVGEERPASMGLSWEQSPVTRLSRTGLVEGFQKRLLPAWCAPLAHGLSLLLVAVAVAVSGWIGASFPPSVSVMWLLSSSSSFLASFLGWEPLKVLLEALYFSLVAKRLHPDEDDTLVESPAVTPVSERVPRVRPPHGFALFLAKEEARKVKRLHDMLKRLLVYMLFLLVTLLANYGDASCHGHAYRLQSAIKQELDSQAFLAITRSDEFWPWMSHVFLPYVHGNQSSPELGPPRLRQVRLQEAFCPDPSSSEHMCSPPTRQSRGCRERSARRPGPGHRTPYRTPPSLELGQPPTTIAAPDTAPTELDTTTNTTSQLRTLLPAPFPRPWTLSPPSSARAQTASPQRALVIVLLHLSAGHCLLPAPFFPLVTPLLYPVRVGVPPVSQIPCCSGNTACAPIPRLLARMPLPGGLWWLLCCRRGFTLLHRDYGDGELSGDGDEDEDDETFELRTPSPAGGGRGSLDVTLTQPTRNGPISDRLQGWEETWSLIPDKGLPEEDPDIIVKGWLYREPRGGGARPWLLPRRAWFVLTRDSLDQFSSSGKGARRLGSLVLTSLCSVTGPERRPKETGLWSVTVSGRKHSIRLCSPRQAEAERWGVALREVIASKAPLETPTQLLLRDIQESCGDPEAVALIYRRNPILRHTSSALYAPLLPLPYEVSAPGPGYAPLREEAVRLFLALQALEGARRPGPLMQGVLQTCRDLPALQDELFLQLAKQTSGPAGPPGLPATQDPATLRYWQLLTCMSCTFRPGGAVRGHLLGHLERTEQALPDSELAEYARFIRKALGRTRGRELVPSLAEISALSRRQELLCTVHCPGAGACPVSIDSHTTAGEVARELVGRLGLARSRNAFALYEQRGAQERALAGGTLVADVLTSLTSEEAGLEDSPDCGWRLCLRLHGPLHPEGLSPEGHELPFLFEQAHALLLRGRPPPPEDTLRALAALRLQSLHRDFSPRGPLPLLDRLLPPPIPPREQPPCPTRRPPPSAALLAGALWSPGLAKRRAERARRGGTGRSTGSTAQVGGGGASTTAAVLGGWKRLRGMGQAEAMAAYLALAAQCPGFGAARYDVLELSTEPGGGAPQKLCLGLGAKAMSLSRPGETEPIHSVSYGHVAACQLIGPHTLALRVGDSQLLLQSPQVEEIMELVNAYLANPSPERPCRSGSSSGPPSQDLPDTSPPSQHQVLEEPQGQSGCLKQLQD